MLQELSLEQMAQQADAVVRATVERSGVRMVMGPQGLEPHTVTRIRVHEWVKGDGREAITLRELGGVWKGGGMRIDGTPEYRAGQEVVVFLEAHPEHAGEYRTFAMVQGKFVVVRGAPGVPDVVRRDTSSVALAKWAEDGMRLQHGRRDPAMQLEHFLSLIRAHAVPQGAEGTGDALRGGAR